ncbi:MAG: amidohydrolase family protein [Spirochaetota bacterium]
MDRIDAHIHLAGDDGETIGLLEELGLKALNICVAHPGWRESSHALFRDLRAEHPERYAWCTTFDLPDFSAGDTPSVRRAYADTVAAALREDLRDGAVAVKAWKNIGMELRRPDGSWVMIDDPIFDPIYESLAGDGVPMIMHIGEPLACWQPLDPDSPHYGYYRDHPEWHLHGRPDVPNHAELIASRDRVLEKHPRLRVVGAHLGSLEHDVSEVAARLERYPNFAVDISARLGDLMRQDSGAVAEFVVAHQDRIIFGTDVVSRTPLSTLDDADRARVHATLRRTYEAYFAYLEGTATVEQGTSRASGLGLDPRVVEKLTAANALAWYPRLPRHRR